MTYSDEIKFLKHIKRKKQLTRQEIITYLSKLKSECNVEMFSLDKLSINRISNPVWNSGKRIDESFDVYALSDTGYDLLQKYKEEVVDKMFPRIISALALVVSIAALIVSIIALQ